MRWWLLATGAAALATGCDVGQRSGAPLGGSAGHAGSGGSAQAGSSFGGLPSSTLPGGTVFSQHQTLEVRLSLEPVVWKRLQDRGNEEIYVEGMATVRGSSFGPVKFGRVGVRHKGAWSLHHCWDDFGGVRSFAAECAKLSYKVKFDEYDEASRLDGLKRINLHAASGDASKSREVIAYATYNEFGVKASRTAPARLYINDQDQGFFIAVEDVDGRFTQAHFPDGPDGNLYKEIWPRTETLETEFVAALETNEERADVSDIQAFTQAIAQASPEAFAQQMEAWVNLDSILRYVAVDRALKNWDGIMAFYSPVTPHNFFWYHDDGAEGRFHLVPWDLDNTFWEFDPYMDPQAWVTAAPIPDWNSTPLNCEPRSVWAAGDPVRITPPRCDPFLDMLARTEWARFTELAGELLDGPLRTERLNAKLDAWRDRVRPILQNDPTADFSTWLVAVSQLSQLFERAAGDFQAFVNSGLIAETGPPPETDLPSEIVNAPTGDFGLHVDAVTNFEFPVPPGNLPADVYVVGDAAAFVQAAWNPIDPLSGTADLRFDFTFNRIPGPFNEWVMLGIGSGLADVSGRTTLMLRLRSDVQRIVRVRVASPAYDRDFGGAWSEFGREVSVGPSPQLFAIDLDTLYYPDWAKQAWSSGIGWTGSDQDALALVLRNFDGLIFAPGALVDGGGELSLPVEAGYLQIDNIYFR